MLWVVYIFVLTFYIYKFGFVLCIYSLTHAGFIYSLVRECFDYKCTSLGTRNIVQRQTRAMAVAISAISPPCGVAVGKYGKHLNLK